MSRVMRDEIEAEKRLLLRLLTRVSRTRESCHANAQRYIASLTCSMRLSSSKSAFQ